MCVDSAPVWLQAIDAQLTWCLSLARRIWHEPALFGTLHLAASVIVDRMKFYASASECAAILHDERTRELLPRIVRAQAEAMVERRWRALLDEPDEQQAKLLQQVSQEEVQLIVDVLLKSNEENKVSCRARAQVKENSTQ